MFPRAPRELLERWRTARPEPTFAGVADRAVNVAWFLAICEGLRVAVELLGYVWSWIRWAAVATGLISLLLVAPVRAEEAKCTSMGANCLCSEPLQATAYTLVNVVYYDPNDSTTKECVGETGSAATSATVFRPGTAPVIGTDVSVLSALPAGNSVARYFRGTDNHTGIYQFDHLLAAGDPRQRVAVRYYMYLSTNYLFANKGDPAACQNSMKQASFWNTTSNSLQFDTKDGANSYHNIYAWVAWAPQLDCCLWGPGWPTLASIPAGMQTTTVGHWYRYEIIFRNATGAAGLIIEAYRKDVTAGTAEIKYHDTSVACTGCNASGNSADDWGNGGSTTTLTPPGGTQMTRTEVNLFRNAGTDPNSCAGYRAYIYLMVAAWNTDSGQRINEATEVEGGAAPTVFTSVSGATFTRGIFQLGFRVLIPIVIIVAVCAAEAARRSGYR